MVRGQGFGSQRQVRHADIHLAKGILFLERLPALPGGNFVQYAALEVSLYEGLPGPVLDGTRVRNDVLTFFSDHRPDLRR